MLITSQRLQSTQGGSRPWSARWSFWSWWISHSARQVICLGKQAYFFGGPLGLFLPHISRPDSHYSPGSCNSPPAEQLDCGNKSKQPEGRGQRSAGIQVLQIQGGGAVTSHGQVLSVCTVNRFLTHRGFQVDMLSGKGTSD